MFPDAIALQDHQQSTGHIGLAGSTVTDHSSANALSMARIRMVSARLATKTSADMEGLESLPRLSPRYKCHNHTESPAHKP